MPELPEVETTRRGIEPALVGRRTLDLLVRKRQLRWPIAPGVEAAVRGQIVRGVDRRAKYLLLRFDTGTAIVHLGMSGSLRLLPAQTPPRPHDHWDLRLETGMCLRYHDPRRFGSLHFTARDPREHPLLARLAAEPLSAEFDADALFAATRGRKVAIKSLLMNSRIVVGVGNIYASEALFRAGVHPALPGARVTRAQARALTGAIKQVLAAAIRTGGTTLRDYVDASGAPGHFRRKLAVYERTGKPCRRCGSPIARRTLGQRATYWCPACQRR
ncbi:MAG TPA: bifunctional DNA-formamidopyrimidine glycosylase/DNA-(apurinic or apyrimidinic site) lyase [Steroidobacteraceae bacterium]|nr:bifunctional DNA-formamidopyrimidine glycosylase/DNA-(apurinic or apyrimidinic site) lyase [Steroidobacteraceae bacterium]